MSPASHTFGAHPGVSEPATEEHWRRAKAVGLTPNAALKRVRKHHPEVRTADEITTEQLGEVLEETLA